tara:strand:- start:2073 stop:2516 length:444 start_codon:yes stop_codon:yes gene_type:complete
MKLIFLIPLFFFLINTSKSDDSLSSFLWKNRLLLIFLDNEDAETVESISSSLNKLSCDLNDRDMLIGWFTNEKQEINNIQINDNEIKNIKTRAKINGNTITVLLIGKDGGIKARYNNMPDLKEVFSLIDRMPMRRSEMKKDKTVCSS